MQRPAIPSTPVFYSVPNISVPWIVIFSIANMIQNRLTGALPARFLRRLVSISQEEELSISLRGLPGSADLFSRTGDSMMRLRQLVMFHNSPIYCYHKHLLGESTLFCFPDVYITFALESLYSLSLNRPFAFSLPILRRSPVFISALSNQTHPSSKVSKG
jgi:hypothetical protein